MKDTKLLPDDPRLTAYALGELDAAECSAVEATLHNDPAARAAVDEIRTMGARLERVLAIEATEEITNEKLGTLAPFPGTAAPSDDFPEPTGGPSRKDRASPLAAIFRVPQLYYVAAGLAAACFAVMLAFHKPPPPPRYYTEITFAPSAAKADEKGHLAEAASATVISLPPNSDRLADTADHMIVSENRGLPGNPQLPANLDRFPPRWAALPVTSADPHDNEFLGAAQNPLSTFSIDVDTASYANVRHLLRDHHRPQPSAVRIEELVNSFPYRYATPASAAPVAASLEVADAPWAPTHRLVRIGLTGREVSVAARPAANLVFLLDVCDSMTAAADRLPLLKESLRLLIGKLRPDDHVAIVTYAGQSGLALPSTSVSHAAQILAALDQLHADSAANGGTGIQLAYEIAKTNFVPGGINRVVLCTDGDFNLGVTGERDLARLIEDKAKSGVALTALGFGMGTDKDARIEHFASLGNGDFGYIDTRREAEKLLAEQVNATFKTIAQDLKIQVEFNPARVASYRLIGYENGAQKKTDATAGGIEGGEMDAGHTVTAFYEIVPVAPGDERQGTAADPAAVRAGHSARPISQLREAPAPELLTVKLRYKEPADDANERAEFPLTDNGAKFADASADFKFAAAVASFGMILRDSPHKGTATLADVVTWAESGGGDDAGGFRAEFVELARDAEGL